MDSDNKTKLTWVGVLRLVVGGIFRLISIVALLAVLGISYLLFQNAKQTKETQNLNVQLVEMRQEAETEEDNTDWSKGMLDINSDYKGWLTIYGTQISEPVVQGETNETYLRTNINGELVVFSYDKRQQSTAKFQQKKQTSKRIVCFSEL